MLFMLFWFSKFVKLDSIEKILYWVFVFKWFISLQLNFVLWFYGFVLVLEFLIYSLGFVEIVDLGVRDGLTKKLQ